ncbi:sulfotransferase [Pseudoxanthomonas sp. PXM02]|uniref:sulfotransferase n=1 Tax=Pseudoxanthomonas sp. PXM02 TaxID=2769294 RepID=UPI00177ECAC5|nr:sulfotransferase [Pseudoxanthomonas sp. PXM02]MBD9479206.1 sulfotransferase [Pseudoxanthomonas sp. PXM02]
MKLPAPFIQLPLSFDAEALAREISVIDVSAWRSHPNGIPGNSALPLITTDGDPDSDQVTGAMRPTPWLERLPYLMQVLETLDATWGRSRLMRLSGQSEVVGHVDINYYWREHMRVHVPIVTTPSVRFLCGEHEVNMAAGECWIFDTWRHHRVLNPGDQTRIHLVADTVGGVGFWNLLEQGRTPERREPGWAPRRMSPVAGHQAMLDYESFNASEVMTPWELRECINFLTGEAERSPQLPAVHAALMRFARHWHGVWACHGDQPSGLPHFRALLKDVQAALAQAGVAQVQLQNGLGLLPALKAHIFSMALAADADASALRDPHGARPAGGQGGQVTTEKSHFERPVFIVSPPRSGSTLLFETLSGAPGVHTIGDESHQLIEGVEGLAPSHSQYHSNQLGRADATPEVVQALRGRFLDALRDREGEKPAPDAVVRLLEKTPKNALRIPFLKAVFPDAKFIYLHRDPRQVWGSMIDGWQSGRFRMYNLPGWEGPMWSFLLTPGWQSLIGQDLGEIVARQWETATRLMLDDLEALPPEDWTGVDYGRFLQDPQGEALRLSTFAGWSWDRELGPQLPLSRYTLSKPDPDKWRRHAAAIEPRLLQWNDTIERAARAAGV